MIKLSNIETNNLNNKETGVLYTDGGNPYQQSQIAIDFSTFIEYQGHVLNFAFLVVPLTTSRRAGVSG